MIAAGVGFGTGNTSDALTIASGIALQNIPEGMVIISPMILSGVSRGRTFVIALTDKRLLFARKRMMFGYFFYAVTPDMFNDLKVNSKAKSIDATRPFPSRFLIKLKPSLNLAIEAFLYLLIGTVNSFFTVSSPPSFNSRNPCLSRIHAFGKQPFVDKSGANS